MKASINTSIASCPVCHEKIPMRSAYCPYCGEGLFMGRPTRDEDIPKQYSVVRKELTEIERKWQSTTLLFLLWLFEFSLVVSSAIHFYFYQHDVALMITLVLFFGTWVFLALRLKRAGEALEGIKSHQLYLALLIPLAGTIFVYYRINQLHQQE